MSNQISIVGLFLVVVWNAIIIFLLTEPRFSKNKNIIIWSVTMSALLVLGYILIFTVGLDDGVFLLGVISMIVVIAVMMFASADCVPKKIFITLTFYNAFYLIVQFSFVISGLFFEKKSVPYQILSIVVRNVIYMICVPLYFKFIHPKFRAVKVSRNSEWWILSVISGLFSVIYITQAMVVNKIWSLPNEYMPVLVAIFVQVVATFMVIFRTISYMNKTAEAELMRQNTKFLTEQIERLTQSENEMRRLRHDMRHHLINIAEHIKRDDSGAALEYLTKYDDELQSTFVMRYCENVTFNNIISAYARRAERAGIEFTCRARASAELPIKDTDLVAILANLLENALCGCLEQSDAAPKVEVYIKEKFGTLIIVVNNTCRPDLQIAGKFPKNKGVGVANVISATEKNDGMVDYSVNDGICSVCAVLRV